MLIASPNQHTAAPDPPEVRPPASPPDEIELVRKAQHSPEAFAPLYERYVDDIFAFCLHRSSTRDQAADLTHQVFARALNALPQFVQASGGGSFRSWLFTIARNLVIDGWRGEKPTTPLDAQADTLRDPARSPEDQAIANEQRHALLTALTHLTPQQRQIVELRFTGHTGPEIAALLDMELPAVKSAQFRAYARLRKLLADHQLPEVSQ